jgi:hypothetical protein
MSGKGSRPRPYSVTQDEYAKNFDLIFRKDRRIEEEQQEEDEAWDFVEQMNKLQHDTKEQKK